MKKWFIICIAFGLILLAVPAFAKDGQNYFKFDIPSRDAIDKLTNIISIDNVKGLTVFAYANDKEFENFKSLGYSYTILPDPGSLIQPAMSSDQNTILEWDVYPTYTAYVAMMNQFATDYPNLCVIENIGRTVQGRALLVAKISANVNISENEPEVLYTSSMHGDETTGYVLMLRLISYLLTNYGVDPQVTNMLNNMEIYINPLANPDGTYHGGNNSVNGATRYNANSVDLNRNYPDPAAGQHPDGNIWQPETVAFMSFADRHHFTISANFHGGAEVFNYVWDTWSRLHPDNTWENFTGRRYADTVHVYGASGYMTDLNNGVTNGYAWYRVTGGRQDYMTYFKGGREATIELSSIKLLPAAQLPAHWNYNYRSFLNYLENALFGIRGIVTDASTGLPVDARITVLSHDADSSDVHTDPAIGDYHRMLAAGTYNLQFNAPGYTTQTINNINVSNYQTTVANVQLQPISNNPILDFVSQNAGNINPGDTANMSITLVNNGGGAATGVNGILSTSDSYVTILQPNSAYPNIPALGGQGTSTTPYRFSVASDCPRPHEIQFSLNVTASGGFNDTLVFSIIAGQSIEDFESGNFASYPWQFGGNGPWTIINIAPYQGTYSSRSGIITHNQNSEIRIQMNVSTASPISFYYKVSSEPGYDFLIFYIDSNVIGQWSGDIAWTQATYNVTAGSHIFKWVYAKDGSVSNGSDCGWIDYIIFPQTMEALQILTPSLPNWTMGQPYSRQLQASGGTGSFTWSDQNNGLNGTGLNISSSGLVSGTPSITGQISFTARVADQGGNSATRPYSFIINDSPNITTTSLPGAFILEEYSCQLNHTGGTGIGIWSDRDNDLDSTGITLSSAGLLSGIPPIADTISFTAVITDSTGATDQQDLILIILSRGGSYVPGDANGSGETNGLDVTYLVNYFKGGPPPPFQIDCPTHGLLYAACDVNASCAFNGIDVTYMVNYFKGGTGLLFCPDCPPLRTSPASTLNNR